MAARKPVSWYRVYRFSDDSEAGDRPYGCYSTAQAVGHYVNNVLKDKTKVHEYYAQEVDGPEGWQRPRPQTKASTHPARPVSQPRPRQIPLDLSGEEIDF